MTVISAMDHINNVLTASSNSDKYSLPIHAALTISKRTLSKYHDKATGELEVYWIVMGMLVLSLIYIFLTAMHPVLHPCHKLEYFKQNGWDEALIETACSIVQDEFNRSYCSLDIKGDNSTVVTTQTNGDITVGHYFADI